MQYFRHVYANIIWGMQKSTDENLGRAGRGGGWGVPWNMTALASALAALAPTRRFCSQIYCCCRRCRAEATADYLPQQPPDPGWQLQISA